MRSSLFGLGMVWLCASGTSLFAQQVFAPAGRVSPIRVAAVKFDSGRLLMRSGWIGMESPRDAGTTQAAFDAFWSDSSGEPTGFCDAGCDQYGWCPSASPGLRWWGGPNFRSPFSTNDMVVAPVFANRQAVRGQFAWFWAHPTPSRCYVAVLTGTQFSSCTTGVPPVSGDLGGVIFDFGMLAQPEGYWWADVDLRAVELSWPLPAEGSYSILLGTAYDEVTGIFAFDQAWGTQPMRWGNGARPGTSSAMQWDDWRNANGVHEWNECSYYNDQHHCPLPQGAMVAFHVEAACYPNCDGSTGIPLLTANDFQCFLNAFAAGQSSANCDGSTGSPTLTANDFQCFLNAFAAGCQ
ncbi:MAG: hypothetical protein KF678_10535 [Phycisphaeraceae bacterium]|nr:hypothetical protein [Phycisphaeraceae bacterium]